MKILTSLTILILFVLLQQSCSVGMALSGNKQQDISTFYVGADRLFVHGRTGFPDSSIQDKDGKWIDTYLIISGDEPSTLRAIGHSALDVVTLGLWEVIGTPIELAVGSEDHDRFEIFYDENDKIERLERFNRKPHPSYKDADLQKTQPYPIDYTNNQYSR